MNDEVALRDALHELTFGQPAAPVDRVAAVRRRHVRRRVTMTTVAAAAAAAIVTAGALLVAGPWAVDHVTPANSPAPTWAFQWPTRYGGAATQSAKAAAATQDEAIAYYERFHGVTLRDPRALYIGTPPGTQVQWVVVEADRQLIALASPDDGLSWTPYVSSAPPPFTRAIGFAWDSGKEGHTVLVLTAPDTPLASIRWFQFADGAPVGRLVHLADGVGLARLRHQHLPGDLFVSVLSSRFAAVALYPESTRGEGGIRQWQKSLQTPPVGGRQLSFEAGAGGGDSATMRVPRNGTITISIRCVGPTSVRLTVVDGARQAVATQRQCDGSDSAVDGQETMVVHRGDRLTVTTETNVLTRFAVGVSLV